MSAMRSPALLMLVAAVVVGSGWSSIRAGATAAPPATLTIRSGVFSKDQASRGMDAYIQRCSACHGELFNGAESAPGLDGTFIDRWKGKTLADVFTKMRTTMPPSPEQKLTDQQYVDIIAQVLNMAGEPAGKTELAADPQALAAIRIE